MVGRSWVVRLVAFVGVACLVMAGPTSRAEAAAGEMTRIELARVLDRLLASSGKSVASGDPSAVPSDVAVQDRPVVARVMAAGLMTAVSGFRPDLRVNLYQVAATLDNAARVLGLKVPEPLPPLPSDVSPTHWAAGAIRRVMALGLLPGFSSSQGTAGIAVTDLSAAAARLAEKGNFQAAFKASCDSAAEPVKAPRPASGAAGSSGNGDFLAERENNDERTCAMPLELGDGVLGVWHAGDRFDYYAIEMPEAGVIRVELGGQPPEVKLQLNAFGFGGDPESFLGFEDSDEGGPLAVDIRATPGKGYLAVKVANVASWQSVLTHFFCRCGSAAQWHAMPDKSAGDVLPDLPESLDGAKVVGPITYTLTARLDGSSVGGTGSGRSMDRRPAPAELYRPSRSGKVAAGGGPSLSTPPGAATPTKTSVAGPTPQGPVPSPASAGTSFSGASSSEATAGPVSLRVDHDLGAAGSGGALGATIGKPQHLTARVEGLAPGAPQPRVRWSIRPLGLVAANDVTAKFMTAVSGGTSATASAPDVTGAEQAGCTVVFRGRGPHEISVTVAVDGHPQPLVWSCRVMPHY